MKLSIVIAAAVCFFLLGLPVYGDTPESENSAFDEAIAALYEHSPDITDEQILKAARRMNSDDSRLYSGLGEEAEEIATALSGFEQFKSVYMCARINQDVCDEQSSPAVLFADAGAEEAGGIAREWDLQSSYSRMLIGGDGRVLEVIPRYKVIACTRTADFLTLDVEEWMTLGYGGADGSGAVCASCYSYDFTLSLKCQKGDSGWVPCGITGTEKNFTWFREEEDPVRLTQEAPDSLFAVRSEPDCRTVGYARIGTDAEDTDTSGSRPEILQDAETMNGGRLVFAADESAAVIREDAEYTESSSARGCGEEQEAAFVRAGGSEDAQLLGAAASSYSYKPVKAAAYADRYWKNYNHKYKEYRGVDCANFVSQCLYAGGMPKTPDWYPQSYSWINVSGHISHFRNYGTFVTAANENIRKGNPVYYDWNGDSTYDHTAICVGTNAVGMPIVDAHTNNVYHGAWSMGTRGRRATILLRANGGTTSAPAPVARNTWKTAGGKIYYVGADGKTVKRKFLTIGGKRYYFNASGVRMTGFFKVGKKWYYAQPSNGALVRGWKKLSGKYYYFGSNYARVQGGKFKIGKNWYFFNNKGIRQTSFIIWSNKWYYADKKTGKFVSGWKKIHGEWYYFDRRSLVKAIGWKTIKGRKCYFNEKGILKKGRHG